MRMPLAGLAVILQVSLVTSQCPHSSARIPLSQSGKTLIENYKASGDRVAMVNYDDVRADLRAVMVDSQEFWPADYGHYGPFFLRLAWHNAGSYRTSDGRGGADGGRQRFEPERSWPDNTNLDKARRLLWPIKQKYGANLSWGDLFVLAGDEAITSSGGQVLGFCGGRVDAPDGSESIQLGPSNIQEELMPCDLNGECQNPLGANTVGLIYVNPEGHLGDGDPANSAKDIRDVFGRMDMNDTETVALIGGGHTIGKTHGACVNGSGPPPIEDPLNPWPGMCGDGKGENAFTSGFELPFTSKPTQWDTEYFDNLLKYEWEIFVGPGGHQQFRVTPTNESPVAISADGSHNQSIGLLVSDVALKTDPAYRQIVESFSGNLAGFDSMFAYAWYKLTTRDMGPRTRCINADAPEAQDWQYTLPEQTQSPPDFSEVKARLEDMLASDPSTYGGFTRLAWQCASSFRVTDYQGGCNGARIRHSPAADWPVNVNLNQVLSKLQPIITDFPSLSWADLIVLAGTTALEKASNKVFPFCSVGRVDDTMGDAWRFLEPRVSGQYAETVALVKDYIAVMGLTNKQFAALVGAGYAIGDSSNCAGLFCRRNSFHPSGSSVSSVLSNIYFKDLLSNSWQEYNSTSNGNIMYKADGQDILMYKLDIIFKTDPELSVIAQEFALDEAMFLSEVIDAWSLLMNADMFDGPMGNRCHQTESASNSISAGYLTTILLVIWIFSQN